MSVNQSETCSFFSFLLRTLLWVEGLAKPQLKLQYEALNKLMEGALMVNVVLESSFYGIVDVRFQRGFS